jgi:hypothetical protein
VRVTHRVCARPQPAVYGTKQTPLRQFRRGAQRSKPSSSARLWPGRAGGSC